MTGTGKSVDPIVLGDEEFFSSCSNTQMSLSTEVMSADRLKSVSGLTWVVVSASEFVMAVERPRFLRGAGIGRGKDMGTGRKVA